MDLQNARILITGGSLGIGKAAAKLLVESGANVIITGRHQDRLDAAAKETGAIPVVADMTSEEDREKMIQACHSQLGGLDVLVNNAGIGGKASIEELTEEKFHRIFNTNVIALAMLTQKAAEIFKGQMSGNIINIASTAALNGYANGTIYAASKFALRGMTKCWQAELRKFNIRVMEINPSEVTTAFRSSEGIERPEEDNKLRGQEIALAIKAVLEMDDRGYIPELTVHATNPW